MVTVPSCSLFEDLKVLNIIAEWVQVTTGDLCHSIEAEYQYWCERVRAVNLVHYPAQRATG